MISNMQMEQLKETFSKSHLETDSFSFVKKFYIKHEAEFDLILPDIPSLKIAVEKIRNKKQLNKAELVEFCFSVYQSKEIFHLFVKTLPLHIQQLFEILLWQEYLHISEAEKLTGTTLIRWPANRTYYSRPQITPGLYIFGVKELKYWSGAENWDFIIFLPKVLKEIIIEYYPKPEHYYFIPVDNIENTWNLFNGEMQILQEMPSIVSYHLQGNIKYTNSGRPNDASINKMRKSLTVAEFYGADALKNMRLQFIAGMLFNVKIKDINVNNVDLLKTLFTGHYESIYIPQLLLTHLKGWAHAEKYLHDNTAFTLLLELLKKLPRGKWISAANIHNYILFRSIKIKAIEDFVINNYIYFEAESRYGGLAKMSVSSNSNLLAHLPYINGSLFLLAAFGLLEINYSEINISKLNETYYSPYDGLQYIRLTALGEYILGITNSYEETYAPPQNKLYLGQDNMTILAEGDLNITDVMLANYTVKEGPGRYRVTSAIFFKDCKTRKSIDEKIQRFKKTIGTAIPKYWESIFTEWQKNAGKVNERSLITVFKIPPEDKALQNAIAKDVVLKNAIYKAEGFHIIVEPDNMATFKSRLKELGYFIE